MGPFTGLSRLPNSLRMFHHHLSFHSLEVKAEEILLSSGPTYPQNPWICISYFTIFNLFQILYFGSTAAKT